MCIRDRDKLKAEKGYKVDTEMTADDWKALTEAYKAVIKAPVSYTHLRAHETVLDLVCRLLLEKTKHKNTTHSNKYKRTHQRQLTI